MKALMRQGIRSIRKRRLVSTVSAVAVSALLAIGLGACSSATNNSSTASKSLNIGVPAADVPSDINPAKVVDGPAEIFFRLAYEPMIQMTDKGTFTAGLAKSFGYVGTGNKEFQFTLRSDAKFSDGTPVTAAAVKSWLTYYGKVGAFASALSIASIDTVGKFKLDLKLNTPSPDVKWDFAQTDGWGYVAAPKAVAIPATLSKNTFGAGPYVYDPSASQTGTEYTFVPNKHFFDQSAIHFKKVVVKEVSSPSSMAQALSAGQIDVGVGDYTVVNTLNKSGFKNVSGTLDWVALSINATPGTPWANAKFRQAVNYAIDRNALVKAMLGGQGVATSEWAPTDGFIPSLKNKYAYNPTKAKQLLQEAGYANGATISIVDNPGAGDDGTPADALVQAMAQQLSKVGVTLKITTVPSSQMLTDAFTGKYDGFVGGFGFNSYGTYIPIFTDPKGVLPSAAKGDQTLLSEANAYLTSSNPGSLAQAATRRITNQAYFVPTYLPKSFLFMKSGLQGVKFPTLSNGLVFGVDPDPSEWHY